MVYSTYAPKVFRSPYMPDTTYAMASPTVMRMPKSFWAPANRALLGGERMEECGGD